MSTPALGVLHQLPNLGRSRLSPEAELHICRVAPGGSAQDLIAALDYCLEQQVDLALFGTGIAEYSALLTAKVDEAWRSGITCVAAAVEGYPAALPQVLTVGAIGQLGTFPPETTDTATVTGPLTAEGFFVRGSARRARTAAHRVWP